MAVQHCYGLHEQWLGQGLRQARCLVYMGSKQQQQALSALQGECAATSDRIIAHMDSWARGAVPTASGLRSPLRLALVRAMALRKVRQTCRTK